MGSQFNQLPFSNYSSLNEIDELTLTANYKNDFDIHSFINQQCINNESIKTLRLCKFGDIGNGKRVNSKTFTSLLLRFSNIELYDIFLNGPDVNHYSKMAAKLKKIFGELKGLSVRGGNEALNNQMIAAFGNNLKFFAHSFVARTNRNFGNIAFDKLEQVALRTADVKTINDILKSAKNIKKISVNP